MDNYGNLKAVTPAGEENFKIVILCVRRLFEGTHATNNECEIRNYISMADKEATKEFLRVTHENYYKSVGEHFGKGITAFFTDEPSLMSYSLVPQLLPILPWMKWYPQEFEKRYGYPYENAVCAVLLGLGESAVKMRCDFWEFISDTVSNGYFKTIKQWCREHNVASTGHLLSEENLQDHIVNYGSYYETLKQFDWPGIDMLGTISEQLMSECVPFARIVSSVADLYCQGESLSEFSDIKTYYGGVYVSISEYYKSVNWHTVMGINNFVSLYAFKDGKGNEFPKADVKALNEYTARTNKFMRLGVRDSKVAVLYPDTSMWAKYTANTNYHAISGDTETVLINETFCKATWELFHRQKEFDVIDNNALVSLENKDYKCAIGNRNYSAIIIPCCEVIKDEVAEKLQALINGGVKVIFIEKIPKISRESGREAAFAKAFEDFVKNGKAEYVPLKDIESTKSLDFDFGVAIEQNGNSRFKDIISQSRIVCGRQKIVMLANMGKEDFACLVKVKGKVDGVYGYDAATGELLSVGSEIKDDAACVSVNVPHGKAKILLFDGDCNV